MLLRNPHGLEFTVTVVSPNEVDISTHGHTVRLPLSFDELKDRWVRWVSHEYVQDAFDVLDAGQREFFQTGFTPEAWSKIFPPNQEE